MVFVGSKQDWIRTILTGPLPCLSPPFTATQIPQSGAFWRAPAQDTFVCSYRAPCSHVKDNQEKSVLQYCFQYTGEAMPQSMQIENAFWGNHITSFSPQSARQKRDTKSTKYRHQNQESKTRIVDANGKTSLNKIKTPNWSIAWMEAETHSYRMNHVQEHRISQENIQYSIYTHAKHVLNNTTTSL